MRHTLILTGHGRSAMLFNIGAVQCLKELGVLPSVSKVIGVSSGAVVAAFMATTWTRWASTASRAPFESSFVAPLLELPDVETAADDSNILTGQEVGETLTTLLNEYAGFTEPLESVPRLSLVATNADTAHPLTLDEHCRHLDLTVGRAVASCMSHPPCFPALKIGGVPRYAFDGFLSDPLGLSAVHIRSEETVLISDPDLATRVAPQSRNGGHAWCGHALDTAAHNLLQSQRHQLGLRASDVHFNAVRWSAPLASAARCYSLLTDEMAARAMATGYRTCSLAMRPSHNSDTSTRHGPFG